MALDGWTWWLLVDAATVALAAGCLVFVHRRRPPALLWPATPLSLAAVLLWALGDLLAELSTNLPAYQLSLFVYYTGAIGTPAATWVLALRFAEAQGLPFAWGRRPLAWLPVAFLGLTWLGMATNPWHHAFVTPLVDTLSPRNWLWWTNAAAAYATTIAVVALYATLRRRHRSWAVRRKATIMLCAYCAPPLSNALYIFHVLEPPVDSTLLGLFVAVGLIMAGVYRTGLFNPLPLALPEVIENDPTGVVLLDSNHHVVYANAAVRKLLPEVAFGPELEFASVLAAHVRRADDPDRAPNPVLLLQEIDPANPLAGEGLYRFAGDPERWLRVSCHTIHSRHGAELGRSLRLQEVTELRHASEALRRSALRFRSLAAHSSDIVTEIGRDGRYRFVSPSVRAVLGRAPEELVGRSLADLCHPDDRHTARRQLRETARGGAPANFTVRVSHADGGWRRLEVSVQGVRGAHDGAPLVSIARDVTERGALVERFVEAQKLESLGILAGGVAHDFNNLLVGVLGNAQLGRQYAEDRPVLLELLDEIEASALRASDLTDQMLTYAGQGSLDRGPLRLSRCVAEMGALLESAAGGVRLAFELGEDCDVEGDAARIRQVVVNLVTNASEAQAGAGGEIRVRTGVQEADAVLCARARPVGGLAVGPCAFVEVADTGPGMDEGIRARMFDPFFSTRFAGRGLGLAAVFGIVRAHRGGVLVESTPGRGTSVRVLLPAAPRGA